VTRPRVVIDTNVYVSRYLHPRSVPGLAVERAWIETQPLISVPAWRELHAVLNRAKFARYVQPPTVRTFLRKVFEVSEKISIPTPIRACRDPRDDKFLELAVHGQAGVLITGDEDLLALHPFRGIAIPTPAEFLARSAEPLS